MLKLATMALGARLSRYRDFAKFFAKYRKADFVTHAGDVNAPAPTGDAAEAAAFAHDLEKLGPTFIKLGQLLSTRADLLPPSYLEALARLQDDVGPFPYEDVERIVQEELGVRLSKQGDARPARGVVDAGGDVGRRRGPRDDAGLLVGQSAGPERVAEG